MRPDRTKMSRGRASRLTRGVSCAVLFTLFALGSVVSAQTAGGAGGSRSRARRISVSWEQAPIRDVLAAFAAFSGASIVAGSGVDGLVTADINDQPWDVALRTILLSHGLVAVEEESGIIRVEAVSDLHDRAGVAPVVTRAYRISYARAEELQSAVAGVLSPRGTVSVVPSTNTLVVSDVENVQRSVAALLH